ncbi:MAG: potassium channel family protein [Pseudomonadota bacterium]
MLIQILIGTATILVTMAVMVRFVGMSIRFCKVIESQFQDKHGIDYRMFTTLAAAVVMVLIAVSICIWIWAVLFRFLDIFPTLEAAIYFALVSFTTVGYGDVVADESWRILTGFVAVNGLIAFGIFTAFLMEVVRQVSTGLE